MFIVTKGQRCTKQPGITRDDYSAVVGGLLMAGSGFVVSTQPNGLQPEPMIWWGNSVLQSSRHYVPYSVCRMFHAGGKPAAI